MSFTRDEKEDELVKALQDAISNAYHSIKKDFFPQEEYCYDEVGI